MARRLLVWMTFLWTLGASAQSWYATGWTKRARLLVPKVPAAGAPLVGFPVYVDLATLGPEFFATVQANGADVVVTLGDGITAVPREVVGLDLAAKRGSLWFRPAAIDLSTDTIFYLYWGNPSAAVANDLTTWGAEYGGVWHLDDAPGIVADATGQSDGGSIFYTYPNQILQAQPGQLSLADVFAGGWGYYLNVPYHPALDLSSDAGTVSAWVRVDPKSVSSEVGIVEKYGFGNTAAQGQYELLMDGRRVTGCVGALANWDCASGTTRITDDRWHHVAMRWDSTTIEVFLDGQPDGTYTPRRVGMLTGAMPLRIAARGRGIFGGGAYWGGSIDEVRVANATRSTDWLLAEYANQHVSYRFVRPGPTETLDGGRTPILSGVELARARVKNGDTLVFDLWADSPGYTVQIDTSSVDSTGAPSPVIDRGDGTYQLTHTISLANTRSDGMYSLTTQVQDSDGDLGEGSAMQVELDNTPPVVTNVFAAPSRVFNNSTVSVSVATDSSGYQVSGNFGLIDDTYLPGREYVIDRGDGGYLLQYTIGALNLRPDGTYFIPVTVSDGLNPVVNTQAFTALGMPTGAPVIIGLSAQPQTVRNGDVVTVHVSANDSNLTAIGAFFNVDSAYLSGSETVTNNGDGTYDVRYTVSLGNIRPNGTCPIQVTLVDSLNRSTFALVQVMLANENDAGTTDAGVAADGGDDAGVRDAGAFVDAGFDGGFDGGELDAGVTADGGDDAGARDAGAFVDAGFDGGFDGGDPDAGEATDGGEDAGASDAGGMLHIVGAPDPSAVCGRAWSYAPQVQDAGAVSWELSGPPGSAVDAATGVVTWAPDRSQVGAQSMTVTVRDGAGFQGSQTFDVVVDCEKRELALSCSCNAGFASGWPVVLGLLVLRRRRSPEGAATCRGRCKRSALFRL